MTAALHGFACPDYRHVPGRNARPSGSIVAEVARSACNASGLDDPHVQYAWRYGLYLIGKEYFWEAHEALEPVWMKAQPNSRERLLVQGFIQLANACLKVEMLRPRAAQRLGAIACEGMEDAARFATDPVLGVNAAQCLAVCRRLVDAMTSGRDWRQTLNDIALIDCNMHHNAQLY